MNIMNKLIKQQMTIDDFQNFLDSKDLLNIFYFNTNKLQATYKDVTGQTIILKEVNNINRELKVGASTGVFNFEIAAGRNNETETFFSHKNLVSSVIKDGKYNTHLMVFKLRVSEIFSLQQCGDVITGNSVLRVLKKNTPRTLKARQNSKRDENDFFEDIYIHLEESFTYGVMRDFLFNEKSFFQYMKPDIDGDDFYMICLKSSFSNIRTIENNPKSFILIEPLVLLRDNIL